jgi:Pro-kumamolisin, activation domain/IPT/TIG domain
MSAAGASGASAGSALAATGAPSAGSGATGMRVIESRPGVPAGARAVGALRSSAAIFGDVVLRPRDNAALVRFIAQASDPGSPLFHRYLPPGAFAGRFGPSRSAVSAAVSWLKAGGLRVTGVSRDGLLIHFSGTAGAVGRAFDTRLESYRLRDGFTGRATTSAVRLPARIAGLVAAVTGLDDLVQLRPLGLERAPASDRGKVRPARTARFSHPAGAPSPCKAATAAATSFGGLTDDQIAHAYGAFGLYGGGDLGAGQHVAIYELEPLARSDVKTFDTCFFGAAAAAKMLSRLHVHSVDGGQPAGPGSGESILDVEDVSAIAPGATIDVYVGPSPGSDGTVYDPVDEYAAIVNADADQVVSTSWGLCEQAIESGQPGLQVAENELFEQAAAQGQSVFSAAGDNGSDDCNTFETTTLVPGQNPLSVDDPSSQPYVVSVGGTTIDDAATSPPRERVWNDGAAGGGGGGGISQSSVMPAWQQAAKVPGIARPGSAAYANANQVESAFGYQPGFCQGTLAGADSSTPCRLVPDVSAQADEFTGAITIYQAVFGGWGTIGGTSSATPIWAATLALVNASSACAANPATRDGVGFASPLLYAVASDTSAYHAAFNDITAGNNDVYGLDNGQAFDATKGYDLASGLGSPRLAGPGGGTGLAYYLCHLGASAARPVVTGISPAQGIVAGGYGITINGSGFESGGVSQVAAVQVGAARIPASQLHVTATTITATVPPASQARPPLAPAPQDGAGPADVIVTLKDDQSSPPSPASSFEYTDTSGGSAIPSVTGVIPYGGPESNPGPVTILGSGFTGATQVTFGGVSATTWTVDNPYRITATPPAFSSGPTCAPLPATGVYAGENAANDICQVQVRVGNSHGTSATGPILPPDEGAFALNSLGVIVPPAGCGCEIEQAPTEYDYVPAPTITSVSTSGAANLASEKGGTVITVHGTGLDPLTINWADFGPASQEFSQDTSYVFMTGTELQIVAPGQPLTNGPATVPFSVSTLAGQSPSVNVTYAGMPEVTGVVNTRSHTTLNGTYGAPDTGGTPIKISGKGLAGELTVAEFTDTKSAFSLGTQYRFTVHGATSLTTHTVGQDPALVNVRLCTATGCSKAVRADRLYIYPPGNPDVTSVSPTSGPVAGGTKVTIDGDNLGCALGVFFGTAKARSFTQRAALLDCGSTITLTATSPTGTAGAKVPVSVETVESYFTHAGHGTTTAGFTYK